jgi:hypothetical protein
LETRDVDSDLTLALTEQLGIFMPVFIGGAPQLVIELRALRVPDWKRLIDECGFFDVATEEGKKAFWGVVKGYVSREPDRQPEGIYVTMNPLAEVYLARASNALGPKGKRISADDSGVVRRRWFVVDADPERLSGVSSTDAEKAAARLLIDGVREDLRARGFPESMLIDSGNGYHLWYLIDLPTDDGGRVQGLLKGLAARHNTPSAKVDTSLFNPSRIIKLPGTWARKGSNRPDRPHRMARVLEVPAREGDHVRSDAGRGDR